MKIEVVDNKRFADILVDGEKWKEVHRRLYKNHLREILRTSTKKGLSDLLLRIDVKIARSMVYKWLALKGYLKAELTKKLISYRIDPEAAAEVLQECEKLGYLDDQREGRLFIQRGKKRGLGPKMLALKLGQKDPQLKGMVRGAFTDEEQRREIQGWIEKKTRSADFSDIKVKQRLYRFLVGKGFDDHLIRAHLFVDE